MTLRAPAAESFDEQPYGLGGNSSIATQSGGLRESILNSLLAQNSVKAAAILREMLKEKDADLVMRIIRDERVVIAKAVDFAIKGFASAGGMGFSFDKMLRVSLSDVLETDYGIKKENVKRKGLTHAEQGDRNKALIHAVEIAKESPKLRKLILDMVGNMLQSGFPAAAFSLDYRNDLGVSARQVADLADNFYLWFIEQMGENELMIGYLYVFAGMDAPAVEAKIQTFEEKDFAVEDGEEPPAVASYNLNRATIDKIHDTTKKAFARSAESGFQKYLAGVSLQETSSIKLIRGWKEARRERDKVFAPTQLNNGNKVPGLKLSATDIYHAEINRIALPDTEFEACLEGVDIIRLQRGDVSARNRVLLSILRFIRAKSWKGRSGRKLRSGSSELSADLLQELALRIMEKLSMYNPAESKLTTYTGTWVQSLAVRILDEDDQVTLPVEINTIRRYLAYHPDSTDAEVIEHYRKAGLKLSPKRLRTIRQTGNKAVGYDDPASNRDGEDRTFGELLDVTTAAVGNFHNGDALQLRHVVNKMLRFLPPRHAYILVEIHIRGRFAEEIAIEMGVSKEAVYQIERFALKGLQGKFSEKINEIFVICDEEAWQNWCADQTDVTSQELEWFRFYLGLDVSNAFGRMQPADISKLYAQIEVEIDKRKIKHSVEKLQKRLTEHLSGLETSKRFIRSFRRDRMFSNARQAYESL